MQFSRIGRSGFPVSDNPPHSLDIPASLLRRIHTRSLHAPSAANGGQVHIDIDRPALFF